MMYLQENQKGQDALMLIKQIRPALHSLQQLTRPMIFVWR